MIVRRSREFRAVTLARFLTGRQPSDWQAAERRTLTTGKSRHRRTVIIPLCGDLRVVLARIPRRATTILTSARRQPWTASGLSTAVQHAKEAANWDDRDLHFHDLRGTAATKFYIAGLSTRVIAEIVGGDEEHVEKIIRRYVGRQAATLAAIAQLNAAKRGT